MLLRPVNRIINKQEYDKEICKQKSITLLLALAMVTAFIPCSFAKTLQGKAVHISDGDTLIESIVGRRVLARIEQHRKYRVRSCEHRLPGKTATVVGQQSRNAPWPSLVGNRIWYGSSGEKPTDTIRAAHWYGVPRQPEHQPNAGC